MSLVCKVSSTTLPVSLSEITAGVKALTRDLPYVQLLVQAATGKLEDETGRVLTTQTWELHLSAWPKYLHKRRYLELRRSPLQSVTKIEYYPLGGSALVEWVNTNYYVDTNSIPGMIVLKSEAVLPELEAKPDAVVITFKAGYGDKPEDVPPMLKLCVLILANYFFETRRPVSEVANIARFPDQLQDMVSKHVVVSLTPQD